MLVKSCLKARPTYVTGAVTKYGTPAGRFIHHDTQRVTTVVGHQSFFFSHDSQSKLITYSKVSVPANMNI